KSSFQNECGDARANSEANLITGEKPEEFSKLRKGLIADFAPRSTIERELVDALAELLWRRRRVPVAEAALLQRLIGNVRPRYELSALSDEQLEQLRQLYTGIEAKLSDLIDCPDNEGNTKESSPTKLEMLAIFTRHETSLMNNI